MVSLLERMKYLGSWEMSSGDIHKDVIVIFMGIFPSESPKVLCALALDIYHELFTSWAYNIQINGWHIA